PPGAQSREGLRAASPVPEQPPGVDGSVAHRRVPYRPVWQRPGDSFPIQTPGTGKDRVYQPPAPKPAQHEGMRYETVGAATAVPGAVMTWELSTALRSISYPGR